MGNLDQFTKKTIGTKKQHSNGCTCTNTKNKKATMQSFEAETSAEILAFDHPNIVKTLAVSSAESLEDQPCFIMEFVSTRNLQHVLGNPTEKINSQRKITKMAHEIISVLVYVHDCNIARLDLKPVNVFRRVGRRVRWVRTPPPPLPPPPPPPPPHGPKRSAWKETKMNLRKKERQR